MILQSILVACYQYIHGQTSLGPAIHNGNAAKVLKTGATYQ